MIKLDGVKWFIMVSVYEIVNSNVKINDTWIDVGRFVRRPVVDHTGDVLSVAKEMFYD